MVYDPSAKTRQIGQLPSTGDALDKPIWAQPRIGFRWEGPRNVGPTILDPVLDKAALVPKGREWYFTWETPWFDLRPDLKSIEGQPKLGVPIWSRSARLYVELVGRASETGPIPPPSWANTDLGIYTPHYSVTAREYYDTTNIDPGQIIAGGPGKAYTTYPGTDIGIQNTSIDVTNVFFPPAALRTATSLGVFYPPGTNTGGGEGYPVRYWKVNLRFKYYLPESFTPPENWSLPPIISLQSTYY